MAAITQVRILAVAFFFLLNIFCLSSFHHSNCYLLRIYLLSLLSCTLSFSSIVFAGFSAESLRSRILDGMWLLKAYIYLYNIATYIASYPASASVVMTADEGVRGGRSIPLKSTVDEAVESCDCVRTVFVAKRTGAAVSMQEKRDVWLEEVRTPDREMEV